MKIGYPCVNLSIGCSSSRTFRLASYSSGRMEETVAHNLECLKKILEFNRARGILFFRISSDLVPFASHPVCKFPWQRRFRKEFHELGQLVRQGLMRISMHPDQFVVLNSLRPEVVRNSVAELEYHAQVLDLMGLDRTAKIQLHLGGVFGDKPAAIRRFISSYGQLDSRIKQRLVIENDERLYSLADCLRVHQETGAPVLLDIFHHQLNGRGESLKEALALASKTWQKSDGRLMVDYSRQKPGGRPGSHADSLDQKLFKTFLSESRPFDFDLMLELKDKESCAIDALKLAAHDRRLVKAR